MVSFRYIIRFMGTHEVERTVLYKTKSLDGTKRNTKPKTKTKTNPNPNTNPNPKLTQILTLFSCFMFFRVSFLIFSLAGLCHLAI